MTFRNPYKPEDSSSVEGSVQIMHVKIKYKAVTILKMCILKILKRTIPYLLYSWSLESCVQSEVSHMS